jgi:hypothetical protein
MGGGRYLALTGAASACRTGRIALSPTV